GAAVAESALIVLAAMAGGLIAVATRDALLSAPRVAAWLRMSVAPLGRAAREGDAPSADEQRRLAMLGSGAIARLTVLIAGPGPVAIAAAAGPWSVGALVARRRERYRRAVERSVPDVASAIADAISGGHSIRGALAAAPGSLEGPSSSELARVAADLELGAS